MRYPKSIYKTLSIIHEQKPDVLFVQNPSMILATLACLCKFFWKYYLVVDRHTTFLLNKEYKNTPRLIIFKIFNRLTIRFADMTIVTNGFLADIVKNLKGNPFILPDMIPDLKGSKIKGLKGKRNILLISSFSIDEPIQEVLSAMALLKNDDVYLYITGNYNKLDAEMLHSAPQNVIFTGFLDEHEFINMLFTVDAIMVLTTADSCMLCGCYEAVSAGKPLITSDKEVLRSYFTEAVFVDNTAMGIQNGILKTVGEIDYYEKQIHDLKKRLVNQWEKRYLMLENQIIAHQKSKK
jgi:glycosyltransferase involved in cell wall biosynthesis